MRAASESPAMFMAPVADAAAREVTSKAASDAPSVFAATLGLVSTTVTSLGADAEEPASEGSKVSEAAVPETTPQAAMQLAMMTPLPIPIPIPLPPPPPRAGEGGASSEVMQGVKGSQRFVTVPAPSGGDIDLSKLESVPVDQQAALPLEAALQQLTHGSEQPRTAAPESAPTRVITAAHEIVEVVSRHVARGEQQITMVLRPAELGQVKVRVEHVRHDQVKITLEAERADATHLLHERVPELQAALAAQGVTVREVNVSMQAGGAQTGFGGGGAAEREQHDSPDEIVEIEDGKRPQKRTAKRNPKDLDLLV